MSRVVCLIIALALLGACNTASSHAEKLPASTAPSTTSASAPTTTTPTTAPPVASTTCHRPHEAGQSVRSFGFEGQTRTYLVYVPKVYTGTAAVPVVFNFHGYGSNALEQMIYGDFRPEADRNDFILVAPNGQDRGGRHFNITREPGLQNDVTMVGALLDRIEAQYCVDSRRVYSTGMSDGGGMTSVLACVMFNRFAAFVPVAVQVYRTGCGGNASIPMEAFHGTADPAVPYGGGRTRCCGHVPIAPTEQTLAQWAAHDGCDAKFHDERIGSDVRKRTWSGCRSPGEVVLYTDIGGGHTWPGSLRAGRVARLGKVTRTIDASALIWEFFAAHELPAS